MPYKTVLESGWFDVAFVVLSDIVPWLFPLLLVWYGNLDTWINLPRSYPPGFYQPRYNCGTGAWITWTYLGRLYPPR